MSSSEPDSSRAGNDPKVKSYLIRYFGPDGHLIDSKHFTGTSDEVGKYASAEAPLSCDDWQITIEFNG